jgi:hypothetical protein
MKVRIVEPGSKVFNGIGFSAVAIAELPAGAEV